MSGDEDLLLAENIRLKQELEALRSLLSQQQRTENSNSLESEQSNKLPESEGDGTIATNSAGTNQLQCSTGIKIFDVSGSTPTSNAEPKVEKQPSGRKQCEKKSKILYAWSWQDETGVWREYNPNICEVRFQD